MTSRRTLAATTLAVALIATLAACDGGAEPNPSPSASAQPSPSSTEGDALTPPEFDTPLDEEAASSGASDAAIAALEALTLIQVTGGEGADSLPLFFMDDALAEETQTVTAITSGSAAAEGTASFEIVSSTVSDLADPGVVLPFGAAQITVCLDYSNFTVQGVNDAEPIAWPNGGRFQADLDLKYSTDDDLWRVSQSVGTGLPC